VTYSILAIDRETNALGAAVQSKFPGVGNLILHAEAGAGIIATQAFSNPRHGLDGLRLLAFGATPADVVRIVLRGDEHEDERQLAVLSAAGKLAGHTGATVESWDGFAGSAESADCYAHGNSLADPEVVERMVEAFDESQGELSTRLIAALRAGQAAGGELRGQQSAALKVVRSGSGYGGAGGVEVDISVYDHREPIEELARCYELHRLSYFPSAANQLVPINDELRQELGTVLTELGYLPSVPVAWNEAAIAALKRFMGVENYDNRLRDDALVDLDVVEDVRSRRKAGKLVKRPG
jgi:uncharacterized Ntn-hydrolase superfamily protein